MTLPDSLKMKEMIYEEKASAEDLTKAAEQFADDERYHDAVSLYAKAGDKNAIEAIAKKAIQTGNLMLHAACCNALDKEADDAELQKLKVNAERTGKLLYAEQLEKMLNPNKQDETETT